MCEIQSLVVRPLNTTIICCALATLVVLGNYYLYSSHRCRITEHRWFVGERLETAPRSGDLCRSNCYGETFVDGEIRDENGRGEWRRQLRLRGDEFRRKEVSRRAGGVSACRS
ncbi:unnamed protein product [Microthlaspi erraticum]|uniref:Uncharacterized protein n=1 Tax=Microthlaspi erraticum TaxID=1685480 RepID=A0A6D2I8Y8_9BRAS|nr:unnamed protein product [Microthlaspi erraticum]